VYDSFCGGYTIPRAFQGLQGLIFDCDGVLFDSLESNKLYYNTILSKLDLPPMTPEQEAYVHVHAVRQSMAFIIPEARHADMEEARGRVDYFREILPHLKPEPGLFELLSGLRAVGMRLAMSTNRTTTMERVAWRFGLNEYFFPIMTASKVAAKPHPEGVHNILRYWGASAANVAYIGDSWVDQATALASGVRFWAYKSPKLNAVVHVQDFWQLIRGFGLWAQRSARGFRPVQVLR